MPGSDDQFRNVNCTKCQGDCICGNSSKSSSMGFSGFVSIYGSFCPTALKVVHIIYTVIAVIGLVFIILISNISIGFNMQASGIIVLILSVLIVLYFPFTGYVLTRP